MIPHDGPPAGSGAGVPPEVGVSGGVPSVDMSKPPPVTGEHEIVGLEGQEGVRKEDSKVLAANSILFDRSLTARTE